MAQSHRSSYSLAASWKKGTMLRKSNCWFHPWSPEYLTLLTSLGLSMT